jgi:RHS repeat-associated protein
VTTANTYLYSGERFDSNLNLYQLRARFYNMLTGRFETMDPAAGKIFDPGTLHKYVYTKNNPVNRTDPSGEFLAEGVPLWRQITAAASVGLLLGFELRELYDCVAELVASSGRETSR